jgi:acyl carrier protein
VTRAELDVQLRQIVGDTVGVAPDFGEDSYLTRDLGADSLDLVDMGMEAQEAFGLHGVDFDSKLDDFFAKTEADDLRYKHLLDFFEQHITKV